METIFILNKEIKNDFVAYQVLKLFFDCDKICTGGYCANVEERKDKDYGFRFFDETYVMLPNEQLYEKISQVPEIKIVPYNKFDFFAYFYKDPLVIRRILLEVDEMLSINLDDSDICIGGEVSKFSILKHSNGMMEKIVSESLALTPKKLLDRVGADLLEKFSKKVTVPNLFFYEGEKVNVYPQFIGEDVPLFAKIYSVGDKFLKKISSFEYCQMCQFHKSFQLNHL